MFYQKKIALSAAVLVTAYSSGILGEASVLAADTVFTDDVIISLGGVPVRPGICIGGACNADAEDLTLNKIRLKESVLRVHFVDTTTQFPGSGTDWRMIINGLGAGASNFFAIQDIDSDTIPFRVDAGALDNALRVDSSSRVGLGTATPAANLHIKDGDTPDIVFEQDGSGGFTPYIWGIGGNHTGFGISDGTAGDIIPFGIEPGAPVDSFRIAANGDVGLGTATPAGRLDVNSGANSTIIALSNDNFTWEYKSNVNTGRFTLGAIGFADPFKIDESAVENLVQIGIKATDEVTINGDLVITGDCTEQNGACADYVFEPDYKLRSLGELQQFVSANKHLPNVPSADDMQKNGVSVTHLSGRLLEKIEELVLYTLEQQVAIEELEMAHIHIALLNDERKAMKDKIDNLRAQVSEIDELKQRLLRLEGILSR